MTSHKETSQRYAVELLELAKRDEVAFRVLLKSPEVDFSIVGFHAQQTVEKCMKAVLSHHCITFPFTHDLNALYLLLIDVPCTMPFSNKDLKRLTPYAVSSRYDLERDEILDASQSSVLVAQAMTWASAFILPK
jgi:HEPN domain-containing protein